MIEDAYKQGYRRIGLLHGHHTDLSERTLHEMFLEAMAANGLEPDDKLIFEYAKSPADPQLRVHAALEKMIRPYRPDFLFVDDAASAVSLRNELFNAGLNLTIYGGDNDALFRYMGMKSFDPCYKQIAAQLLNLLLHPETRSEIPVIEAVYKK